MYLILYFFICLSLYYIYNKIVNITNFINYTYIYNQSWEDSDTDKIAYKLTKNNNILMITTGGDNVLNYLINEPESIDTVDFNKHQNYLLEMKMALIQALSWEDCVEVLCYNNYKIFINNYHNISLYLSDDAKSWWDKNKTIMKNFHYSGIVKYFSYFIKFLIYIGDLQPFVNELKYSNFESQKDLYYLYKSRIQYVGNILYKCSNILIPFIGVPTKQANLCNIHCNVWLDRILNQQPFHNNYFYYSYLYGEWDITCCPAYLKKENYNKVKDNLHKINIFTDKLENISKFKNKNSLKYDRVILLDHMDWMDDTTIINEINNIIPFTEVDCKFCWRSFSLTQPFACLNNINYQLSQPIFPNYKDRVGMYNSIHVATITNMLPKIHIPSYNISYKNKLKIFAYTIFMPLLNIFQKNKKKFMDNYYKYQVNYYDAYRFKMLHGKIPMLYSINYKSNDDILIVAGGTGDILEYIKTYVSKCKSITVIDICDHMIDYSKKRVKENNWTNVTCICQNALDINTLVKYDTVIISYSLTMIPEWKKVIDISIDCLKSGGQLAVSDFTFTPEQYKLTKKLFNFIFSFSYINVNQKHIWYLQNKLNKKYLRCDYGSFPNLPGIYCPYYYGLFIKP